jgi:ribonuclease-3
MRRKASATPALQERLGYRFNDQSLLEQAVTHSSAAGAKRPNYQRFEFLGDRVLGLAISDMLLKAFPNATEGELSRRLADLVRAESCAAIARDMQLDAVVKREARLTQTILADVCEAVVGAVFLDGGYPAAADVIERFWNARMITPVRPLRDPKTRLQEWAQGRGLPAPNYREMERSGPHHDPHFRVLVELPQRAPAEGSGRTKRAAEQAAATALLEQEGVAEDERDG